MKRWGIFILGMIPYLLLREFIGIAFVMLTGDPMIAALCSGVVAICYVGGAWVLAVKLTPTAPKPQS